MAWIEYHTALRDHWKIKRLATALKIDYTTALGIVSCLWLWCAEYSSYGDLRKFTDEEIRFFARDPSSKLTKEVLKGCGLLTDGGFINDWGKYGLKLLQSKRKANREYMRKRRSSGYPQDTQRIAIPNHTIPNHINKESAATPPSSRNPKMVNLKDININISEPSKHKLYNKLIATFNARGWPTNPEWLKKIFSLIVESVRKYDPKSLYPYFDKTIQNWVNNNAEWLSGEVKKIRDLEPNKISELTDSILEGKVC